MNNELTALLIAIFFLVAIRSDKKKGEIIMEFKSQICTNVEQSKRLLEIGLKPETADMCFFRSTDEDVENPYTRLVVGDYILNTLESDDNIPAWSLHRLMKIGDFVNVSFLNIEKMYECCIQMLEGQIRGGVINQKYLNK